MKKNRKTRNSVTAKDVAKLVGVSTSTVSRVISGSPHEFISEKTRKRVLEAAEKLGYTPDPIARALRGKESYLLGLIVREIADPFFAELISEISTQAREKGYNIVLGHVRSDPLLALEINDMLDIRHTDGVLFLGDLKDDDTALESILQGKHEVIALCRTPSAVPLHIVNVDNVAGVRALLDHLNDLGHRRIGFMGGGWPGDIQERQKAFLDYIHELGSPFSTKWLRNESNTYQGGYHAMKQLVGLEERPTAVIAADDVMAIGALKAASDIGIRVPDDISVAGFDDIEIAQYLSPSLTTVRQPIKQLSQKAIELMLDLISGSYVGDPESIIRIPPKFIARESTGPIPIEDR